MANKIDKLHKYVNGIGSDFSVDNEVFFDQIFKGGEGIINMSSASTLNLFEVTYPDLIDETKMSVNIQKIARYPGLVTKIFDLEIEVVTFLSAKLNLSVRKENIAILDGALTSPAHILEMDDSKYVLVPEMYYRRQLSIIRATGKTPVAIPQDSDGLLDTNKLSNLLAQYTDSTFILLNHNIGKIGDKAYWNSIEGVLKQYDKYCIVDNDIFATTHFSGNNPLIYRDKDIEKSRFITLLTMSKELAVPSLRIASLIGPQSFIYALKKLLLHKIELVAAPSIELAKYLFANCNIDASAKELKGRMSLLKDQLNKLNFKSIPPDTGINLFTEVPRSFQILEDPGSVFAYLLAKKTNVLVRPGSVHGEKLKNYVRFVISQKEETINEVFNRFNMKGVHGEMTLNQELVKDYNNLLKIFQKQNHAYID
jgi:aspartate/methionine/tyrosine aminotransferase